MFKTATILGTIILAEDARALRHGRHAVLLAVQHLVLSFEFCDAQEICAFILIIRYKRKMNFPLPSQSIWHVFSFFSSCCCIFLHAMWESDFHRIVWHRIGSPVAGHDEKSFSLSQKPI